MRVHRAFFLCHAQIWIVGRVTIRSFASGSAFGVTIFTVRSGGSLSARPRLVRPRLPVAAWLHRWTLPCAAAALPRALARRLPARGRPLASSFAALACAASVSLACAARSPRRRGHTATYRPATATWSRLA